MSTVDRILRRTTPSSIWTSGDPVREELFSVERLERHAETLAAVQTVTARPAAVLPLATRLTDNAAALLAAYRASAVRPDGRPVEPAAEWLLDNYHLVEEQIREIRDDLPPGYYRQLPKLADGPFAGYPRVFGLAWAFVAHTDSRFDAETLRRFVHAYQRVQPLSIGELWALAITLRIILVENLRRLADQIGEATAERAEADAVADRLIGRPGRPREAAEDVLGRYHGGPLPAVFAGQLAKRLRDQDPEVTPARAWLDERLGWQDSTIDTVVHDAQRRQGACNVTVRNIITSMRLISNTEWPDVVESVSLVDERLRAACDFAALDFPTRDLYRKAIEELARGSGRAETDVADVAIALARQDPPGGGDAWTDARHGDPGYYLIAAGRPVLERDIGFRPPALRRCGRIVGRLGVGGYVAAILAATAVLLAIGLLILPAAPLWVLAVLAVAGLFPAMDAATALVERVATRASGAKPLAGLELKGGVPASLRTVVAVPTMLTTADDLREQIERLEVHHLSNSGGELSYALLTDGVDADQEDREGDAAMLAAAADEVARLNRLHAFADGRQRFFLLHRRRLFNASEGRWMGWERKRGKLHELNRLLRGATDTSFVGRDGAPPTVPADVRYVITLDADTRLPRDAARRLVGKMAHPLNRPRRHAREQRIVEGYGVLQPRVTTSLPMGREGSLYQALLSAPGGMDPYAAAVSDVYQDLFGEGSYTGKGIYDIDAFEWAMEGRVPPDTLLSHDLFEGVFTRSGLVSDIEVFEDAPARYDVAAKRQHRWVRGDWQLLPWITGRTGKDKDRVPPIGLVKMLDNLRRSLQAPMALLALAAGWLLPLPAVLAWTAFILAMIAVPSLVPLPFALLPRRAGITLRSHLGALGGDVRIAASQVALRIVFLADQAWLMIDAIARTLFRLGVSHRHLLEWVTAAQAKISPRLSLFGFYRRMSGGVLLGTAAAAVAVAVSPASWPVVLAFVVPWLAAPAIALWLSRSSAGAGRLVVSDADARELRLIGRRTWRYFETFVTPLDSMLPPDNFQEDPEPVIAHRTSPTNIGLYLLSAVAARDFGWAGTTETVERLEATLATMAKLERHRGHFFNWYDTRDLRVLEPAYVSSVDSGNLAGHLIALANACTEWTATRISDIERLGGLQVTMHLAREALERVPEGAGRLRSRLSRALDDIAEHLSPGASDEQSAEGRLRTLKPITGHAVEIAETIARGDPAAADVVYWTRALRSIITERQRDLHNIVDMPHTLTPRLLAIAATAREMALAMEFGFLLDPEKNLLSIGYSLSDNQRDASCYDLLASEARLASLFAIAKGDVGTRHWFRLGRLATPVGRGSALNSWSGSMFEYLMPSLVLRAPVGSILEQTNRLIVGRQKAHGRSLGVPWGVSESAYNARDLEFTYQYSNFGVPGLGLKRGLGNDAVVAPYATALATMVDPRGALRNFAALAKLGGRGDYGFYEALDFTARRLAEGERVAVVRAFMAHHQGMTIVAIANTLHDGCMRRRFHAEPMIQATDLLLQERMPRDAAVARPRTDENPAGAMTPAPDDQVVRRLRDGSQSPPAVHLLSNGDYSVMLTAAGSGYSRWHDLAVTRWREDAARDDCGSYVILRNADTGRTWSAGLQPTLAEPDSYDVTFGENHAEFSRRDGSLVTTMDVLVSPEDDAEVRRVTIANVGRADSVVEVTSYGEVVLAPPADDDAHPAFSKMFVETEYLPDLGALVATRRRRSRGGAEVWAAHVGVVEGVTVGDIEVETDRARFIGRDRRIGNALAVTAPGPLSGSVGTVLDPVFAMRRRLSVPAGEVARIAFWTIVAASRDELLDLIDKHRDLHAFDRARTLAWTQAQVELRHIGATTRDAAEFQRLAGYVVHADRGLRSSSGAIARGAGSQSRLWRHGISGDRPIVLVLVKDAEDMTVVREIVAAHQYWQMKRLAADLVIVNERQSSYVQDLQNGIDTMVRSARSRAGSRTPASGDIFTLRTDLMTAEDVALLRSVARIVLVAGRGSIGSQIAGASAAAALRLRPESPARPATPSGPAVDVASLDLDVFNGLGGFARNGREYVTVLAPGRQTPAPWINVVANPDFGFQASATGSGYTWAENSRENQLTPWSNDAVSDPPGEAFYVRDDATGALWSPTAQPCRDDGTYVARHGFGYCRFEHTADGIALDLLQYAPLADPVKISRLTIRNLSARPRRLSITAYVEWVLGTRRAASAPFVVTEMDEASGAMLARNPWNGEFPGRVAFADLGGRQTAWTGDRGEFIGRNGSLARPAALTGTAALSGRTGAGIDPCSALSAPVALKPGESVEIVVLIGQAASTEQAQALIAHYRAADLDAVLAEVTDHWEETLGAVQVETPDRAMDIMLNGWLLYQTIACRLWARSAFYQASGAFGFRDQLQDGMALTFIDPATTRGHLLRAAGRQFPEGDVQHWWLPATGRGVRTRISDDRVWLAFGVATYIDTSGDAAILDEIVPFLDGPEVPPGAHDAFFLPEVSDESATLFEHCARGIDQCIELTGTNGMPLIGTGDWNDGMNRVGEDGRGTSVWLGWLLIRTIALFAPFAADRDPARARRWEAHAEAVRAAIEAEGWDGDWYRRGTFDDGTPLGSTESEECRIDSIAQSWAVLSGAADPDRAARAMAAVEEHLLVPDPGLLLLFAPPFDKTSHDPGYIKGYPPGGRENGGQYSHAAMWAIMAFARLGRGDTAARVFSLLNPINHARSPERAARYKVEPYVVAADVYSVAPLTGRGGWTWYTGSAGWMYRAGIESILGLRQQGAVLHVAPCIPAAWPGFKATLRQGTTRYEITVENPDRAGSGIGSGIAAAVLDGDEVDVTAGLSVPLDGSAHCLRVVLGPAMWDAQGSRRHPQPPASVT
ncbi:GH36-type glycosyl hydrolase domain-containing protein [Caenispirillum bisanense]|uniref:Cyclic beta-1,2-glucan synthetase n=1 Tax=Caenispirillum bisanense TaxID=414052 RepID=A0A286GCU5_9PROT|nr:glucoamylase family protein [Caenispirillum bisanense]SOD93332.1 cyclic beta-1,2-glucan synthetase [Caenispirillum bisanense]